MARKNQLLRMLMSRTIILHTPRSMLCSPINRSALPHKPLGCPAKQDAAGLQLESCPLIAATSTGATSSEDTGAGAGGSRGADGGARQRAWAAGDIVELKLRLLDRWCVASVISHLFPSHRLRCHPTPLWSVRASPPACGLEACGENPPAPSTRIVGATSPRRYLRGTRCVRLLRCQTQWSSAPAALFYIASPSSLYSFTRPCRAHILAQVWLDDGSGQEQQLQADRVGRVSAAFALREDGAAKRSCEVRTRRHVAKCYGHFWKCTVSTPFCGGPMKAAEGVLCSHHGARFESRFPLTVAFC